MVSAVILAYNRCAEVLKTIGKLKQLRLSLPFELEIIVVDNASSDNTFEEVKAAFPDIVLLRRNRNSGVAGWNDGFKVAKNKYLLVLDDDSHMESGLIEAVAFMEENAGTGILGFEIVDEALMGDPYLDPEEAWKDNDEIAGFIGCGALIRKEVYNKIGGFAEWLFIYTHEFEYAIRCLNAGYKVLFFAKGIVVHRASALNRSNKRLRVFGTRNEMGIIYKFFDKNRWKYIFRILFNNLKFIKREGLKSGYYVIQGFFEFLKIRRKLEVTPVGSDVQKFYAENFWGTKPVFLFVKTRLAKLK